MLAIVEVPGCSLRREILRLNIFGSACCGQPNVLVRLPLMLKVIYCIQFGF
jgi:hypothetical protein